MPDSAAPDPEQLIATGRRVVGIEADGLVRLAATLGPSFAEAVRRMLDARGRVIVSGMGKSGHVARKIAATLASTGTGSGTWSASCSTSTSRSSSRPATGARTPSRRRSSTMPPRTSCTCTG